MAKSRVPWLDIIDIRLFGLISASLLFLALAAAVGASAWDEFEAARLSRRALAAYHEGFLGEAESAAREAAAARKGYLDPDFLVLSIRARSGAFSSPKEMREAYVALQRDAPPGREDWVESGILVADVETGVCTDELQKRLEDIRRRVPCVETSLNLAAFHALRGKEGDVEKASAVLQEALAAKGTEPPAAGALLQAYVRLASVHERLGDYAAARRSLERARWVVGCRTGERSTSRPGRASLLADLAARIRRIDLLEGFSPWRIEASTLHEAGLAFGVAKDRIEVDRALTGRLGSLLALRTLQKPRTAPEIPGNELAQISAQFAEGAQLAEKGGDPLPRVNAIAFSLLDKGAARSTAPLRDAKALLAEYDRLPEDPAALPPQARLAAEHNRAVLRFAEGKLAPKDAAWALQKIVQQGAENPAIHRNLGVVRERMGEAWKAVEAYRRSLELQQEQPDLKQRLLVISGGGKPE